MRKYVIFPIIAFLIIQLAFFAVIFQHTDDDINRDIVNNNILSATGMPIFSNSEHMPNKDMLKQAFINRYWYNIKIYSIYDFVISMLLSIMLYIILKNSYKEELGAIRVFGRIIHVLTKSLAKKSDYTWTHSDNVSRYAVCMAREMNFNEKELEIINWGSLLHDIGKIGIPETILDKTGKLTDSEYEVIKQHTIHGREIVSEIFHNNQVEGIERYQIIIDIVTYHHEKFDGSGYPFGIHGESIPIYARIIALADSFEAMIAERPYKRSKTVEEAIIEIKRCSGTHFDPEVVKAFLRCIEKRQF